MDNKDLLNEYIEKMENIPSGDTECDHIEADHLLCELLEKLGFEQVVIKFKELRKWYA